jgi:hypothetical protein
MVDSYRQSKYCFPDKDEQRLIAEALTDPDALLAAMEKLIAKKRAIKQVQCRNYSRASGGCWVLRASGWKRS